MIKILYIGFGGFIGSVIRYWISGLAHRIMGASEFPIGTLAVNVIGCFLIGLIGGLVERQHLFSPEVRLFIFFGFLGGFTTFSTFGYEVISFARDGQLFSTALNILLHLILGFGAVWLGYVISRISTG